MKDAIYGCDGMYPVSMSDFFPADYVAPPVSLPPVVITPLVQPELAPHPLFKATQSLPKELLPFAHGVIQNCQRGLKAKSDAMEALYFAATFLLEMHPEVAAELGITEDQIAAKPAAHPSGQAARGNAK